MCSFELQYTSHLNLIDLERFENRLLGPHSINLVHNAYWEKSCNLEDYKVNASSTYSYEFNPEVGVK